MKKYNRPLEIHENSYIIESYMHNGPHRDITPASVNEFPFEDPFGGDPNYSRQIRPTNSRKP